MCGGRYIGSRCEGQGVEEAELGKSWWTATDPSGSLTISSLPVTVMYLGRLRWVRTGAFSTDS